MLLVLRLQRWSNIIPPLVQCADDLLRNELMPLFDQYLLFYNDRLTSRWNNEGLKCCLGLKCESS